MFRVCIGCKDLQDVFPSFIIVPGHLTMCSELDPNLLLNRYRSFDKLNPV